MAGSIGKSRTTEIKDTLTMFSDTIKEKKGLTDNDELSLSELKSFDFSQNTSSQIASGDITLQLSEESGFVLVGDEINDGQGLTVEVNNAEGVSASEILLIGDFTLRGGEGTQIVVGDDKNNLDDIRKNPMYLIYEYIDHDLAGVLKRKKKISQDLVRCYTYQLLQVLAYLHSIHIMHRDLKLSNILVTNNNKIKLCDFGLARKESILLKENERRYTNNVITLWYRPPELLFGATNYDTSVDMWSVGCILGELLLGKVLFKGTTHLKSDKKNVDQIIKRLIDL